MEGTNAPNAAGWYWSRNYRQPVRIFMVRKDPIREDGKDPLVRLPSGHEKWVAEIEQDLYFHIHEPTSEAWR